MEVVSLKMASGTFGEERETKKAKYDDQFEETELRLGLPGTDQGADAKSSSVDSKLNLVKMEMDVTPAAAATALVKEMMKNKAASSPPAARAPVVGWPPVRSFRKNTLSENKMITSPIKEESTDQKDTPAVAAAAFVKVSMDGAPYLRKVDLNMYKTYQDLCDALAKMFCSFTIGKYGGDGMMKDFMNDNKLVDLLNGSEYVATYEDKDGDWMLVGDVPWVMFIESCKRMRIMKGKEAVGLAPRAMEKCKNRN